MYWESFKIIGRNIFRDNKEYLKILKVKPKKKRTVEEKETPGTPGTPVPPGPPGKNEPTDNNENPALNTPTGDNELNTPHAEAIKTPAASADLNAEPDNDMKDN